ncbi:RNA-guided endonuclease TnpB family protein [Levilactobacillus zymae]|uniref:RNA-guided endonuclease TnpB family protein n=1 Tax=Levilactobacillus zymae TaxID=267363 RepID=UPI0028BBC8B7|nr:RNA-guided endonuclease TnpB family protein [Levilactobacillus zymae]MDT6979636.1 RNA-guided endonuclease TnpB family protein [Levilactobacillus zymae]
MLKGIKLRLYPTRTQEGQLWQLFGNNRFVWNQMLAMAKARYKNNPGSRFINEYGMNNLLKALKIEYPFLKLSDSTSLQVVNHHLAQAFSMLFKHRGGQPHFKSRRSSKQAYTGRFPASAQLVVAKRRVKLPKLGSIKTSKTGQLVDGQIKRYTVSHDATGRYYLSLQVEFPEPKPLPKTGAQIGIDLGVADLAITSNGRKYPKFQAPWEEQQGITWQRKFDRRKHQAKVNVAQWNHDKNHLIKLELNDYQNWQRAKQIKARYQRKLANRRKDYLSKLTTQLVKVYDVIVIEDLKIKNLMHNHHLAKSIANASWYQFRTMLDYKCKWYGKKLIVVNPNYTSQQCSSCGFQSGQKPLEIREWICPHCGTHHDRDINAAVNILHRGLKTVQ